MGSCLHAAITRCMFYLTNDIANMSACGIARHRSRGAGVPPRRHACIQTGQGRGISMFTVNTPSSAFTDSTPSYCSTIMRIDRMPNPW